MIPTDLFARLPQAASLLVLATVFQLTNSHALPRATSTVPHHELDVVPYPPMPTAAPMSLAELNLFQRQFNTICGFIGGDSALPATCSAGSHCVVDQAHGAIGCCPDAGACTQGVFTGCVDFNSNPQNEINPYVFTCSGSDVCYKNTFQGGFFQWGCGSTSALATHVKIEASGDPTLDLPTISVPFTEAATHLSKPTVIGTKKPHHPTTKSKHSSKTKNHQTKTTKHHAQSTKTQHPHTKTTKHVHTTATATKHKHTKTKTRATQTSSKPKHTKSTATKDTASSTSASTATMNPSTDAPGSTGSKPSSHKARTAAIIGGSVGGAVVLLAALAAAFLFWRRRKGNSRRGPGLNTGTEYISPMQDGGHTFSPLEGGSVAVHYGLPPPDAAADPSQPRNGNGGAVPFQPNYPYGYGPGSTLGGIAALRNNASSSDSDRVPLTQELDDFSRGFNVALDDIQGDDASRPEANGEGMAQYPGPRGNGGRPLWQQNRRQSRNLMWM